METLVQNPVRPYFYEAPAATYNTKSDIKIENTQAQNSELNYETVSGTDFAPRRPNFSGELVYEKRKNGKNRAKSSKQEREEIQSAQIRSKKRRVRRPKSRFSGRQSGGGLADMASTAMKLFSLVQSVSEGNADVGTIASAFDLFSGLVGSASSLAPSSFAPAPLKSKPPPSNPDRIDTAAAAAGGELDEAIGTLMIYGGQYLRKLAVWGYEYATAVPTDLPVDNTVSSSSQSVSVVRPTGRPSSSSSSVVTKKGSPLQTLSPEALEKLGLKAVAAGANPTKLQQAFASAQISGDWTLLEKEIVNALGADALPAAPAAPSLIDLVTGGGSSSTSSGSTATPSGGIMSTISNTISGLIGGSSGVNKVGQAAPTSGGPGVSTTAPEGGMAYYALVAEQFMDKMDRVVNGIPEGAAKPVNSGPLEVASDSIVTRFINEFELQKEALALQMQVNSAIQTINTYIGDEQENSVNKIGVAAGASNNGPDVSHSQVNTGILATIMSVPNMVSNTVAAAFKFLSPSPTTASSKVDTVPGSNAQAGGGSFNVADYASTVNTVALGALGSAALGSVLWSAYVTELEEKKKRRRLDVQEYPYYQDGDNLGTLDYTNYDYTNLQDLDYYEQDPYQNAESAQQYEEEQQQQPSQLAGYPVHPEHAQNQFESNQSNQFEQSQHWVAKRSAELKKRNQA